MLKKTTVLLFLGYLCFVAQGCSTRAWYEGMREGQRQDCHRIGNPAERQACLDEVDEMSYDRYEKERKESSGQ